MGDLLLEIGKLVKEYEDGVSVEKTKEEDLYSINQVIDLYPMLSKHILTNAINNSELKVTWIGNKRYFNLSDIDDYLQKKQDKVVNDIPENLKVGGIKHSKTFKQKSS